MDLARSLSDAQKNALIDAWRLGGAPLRRGASGVRNALSNLGLVSLASGKIRATAEGRFVASRITAESLNDAEAALLARVGALGKGERLAPDELDARPLAKLETLGLVRVSPRSVRRTALGRQVADVLV